MVRKKTRQKRTSETLLATWFIYPFSSFLSVYLYRLLKQLSSYDISSICLINNPLSFCRNCVCFSSFYPAYFNNMILVYVDVIFIELVLSWDAYFFFYQIEIKVKQWENRPIYYLLYICLFNSLNNPFTGCTFVLCVVYLHIISNFVLYVLKINRHVLLNIDVYAYM